MDKLSLVKTGQIKPTSHNDMVDVKSLHLNKVVKKVNDLIDEDTSINSQLTALPATYSPIAQVSGSLTDGAPTDAEIDAVLGTTPSVAGAGYERKILDSSGTGLIYLVISDGTDWQYVALTKAV